MDISIIIVNWNVQSLLHQCLKSIFVFSQNVKFEIIVVDNNSHDGSVQMLNELTYDHKNLKVIFNDKNLGFAKANNQGLKMAKGNYVLFMNPDMEFVENTPKLLMNYMHERQDVDVCTCQLQYSSGEQQPNIKRDPTFWSQFWILYKLHHLWQPKFLKSYLAKDFDYAHEQEVEQIMGAFVFTKRDIMNKLKGWSEDYFIWFEDIDLCKRLRAKGKKIIYTPITRVIHHEGKSFAKQLSFKKQKRFNKSLLTYFKKYHSGISWFILTLVNWDSLVLAWFAQIFRLKPKSQSRI